MKLLPFVVTGLISGVISLLLSYYLPEHLLFESFFGIAYPGIILGLAFLLLGKALGTVPNDWIIRSSIILITTAVAAQVISPVAIDIQYYISDYPISLKVLEIYPALLFENQLLQMNGLPIFLLPTPIVSALQVFIIALGISFSWQVAISRQRIVITAAIYAAVFSLLTAFLSNIFLNEDSINLLFTKLNPAIYDQLFMLHYDLTLIVSPLIWHTLLLVAIYLSVRTQSSSVVSTDDTHHDTDQSNTSSNLTSSLGKARNELKQSIPSGEQISTSDTISDLSTRYRTMRQYSWVLMAAGLLFITGASYYYQDKIENSVPETHQILLQEHASSHPLHSIWPALKKCNFQLRTLADVLQNNASETLSACESQQLDHLKNEHIDWLVSLNNNYKLPFHLQSELLLRNEGRLPYYVSEYAYFHPHRRWERGHGFYGQSYWLEYRWRGHNNSFDEVPTGAFLNDLNRSWGLSESIHRVKKPREWLVYTQLLTPIVVDGVTQALILSEIDPSQMDDYVYEEWASYSQKVILMLVALFIIFLWLEYRTLGAIPKSLNLIQWETGIWRPSLIRLYMSDDFRHRNLLNMAIIMPMPVLMFYITEPIFAFAILVLPLLFTIHAIIKVIADYRLFAQGIPVPCEMIDTTAESTIARVSISGVTKVHYAINHYEAHYQDKIYRISASESVSRGAPLIALIDPNRGERGVLLNAFCERN